MTEEEKNSIEDLKEVIELYNDKCLIITEDDIKSIKILLNLFEKYQKEIEELKEDNKKKSIVIIEYQDLYEKLEDKIKAKIEEFKTVRDTILKDLNRPMMTYDLKRNDYCEKMLQSLLRKEFPVTITKEELEKRWKE